MSQRFLFPSLTSSSLRHSLVQLSWSLFIGYPTVCKNVKVFFLYSAVSSPLDRSKRFTLFLPWQTCSFRHQLGFSWKHSSHAAITRKHYSLPFTPLSIARYSFIQLSRLRRREENENAQTSKRYSKGGFEPGLSRWRVRHSTTELPCSTCDITKYIM